MPFSLRSLSLCLAAASSLMACQSQPSFLPPQRQSLLRAQHSRPEAEVIPGEFVLRYQTGLSAAARLDALQRLGLQSVKTLGRPELGFELVSAPAALSPTAQQELLHNLNQMPQVLYAEPNYRVRIPGMIHEPETELLSQSLGSQGRPNDPLYSRQYAHARANSEQGWRRQSGAEDVTIAIVDTGIDLQHPDLVDKITPGWDAVDGDGEAHDGHGHGTHCAGIAAASTDNQIGVAGFAPNVKLMPIRVLDDSGSGSSADVAEGILWAADHGAQVISMSLGSYRDARVKADAVKYALKQDAVLVAAMGNDGNKRKIYPAAQKGVIAVGSTDKRDKRSYFSNYGSWISVSAPGSRIMSTFPTDGPDGMKDYGSISGTSMATPAVAGVAALIRSEFPHMNQQEVKAQLEWGTDDLGQKGWDHFFGHGRINVSKALTRRRP